MPGLVIELDDRTVLTIGDMKIVTDARETKYRRARLRMIGPMDIKIGRHSRLDSCPICYNLECSCRPKNHRTIGSAG